MLKYRLLTALILIPLVLSILFYAPRPVFIASNALAILVAGWEWTSLSKIKSFFRKSLFLSLLALTLIGSFWASHIILWIAAAWWIIAGVIVLTIRPHSSEGIEKITPVSKAESVTKETSHQIAPHSKNEGVTKGTLQKIAPPFAGGAVVKRLRGGVIITGLLILTPTFTALNLLYDINPELILWLFLLIWGADSCAYFAGKLWGKHKLIPHISPGKTWEGFIAALLTCLLIGALASLRNLGLTLTLWLGLAFIIGVISVLGDLFESLIKRIQGVKDSGSILPGHGGILDRIDSLTAAAPVFAFLWILS